MNIDQFIQLLQSRKTLYVLAAFFTISLLFTYSNHYDNGFQFDDTHTIVHNNYIRDLDNFTLFFTDIATFGTMPNNRGYRPVVTTMNAIDFWRGREDVEGREKGHLKPSKFHSAIMFWYLFQCVLMFFMFRFLMNKAFPSNWNSLIALIATAWYAHHTANAETINYIISRSDSFSTFCIVAALTLYISPLGRKFFLYLIPMIVGVFTKETGIIFVPILFFYILLFENNVNLAEFFLFNKEKRKDIIRSLKQTVPAAIVGISIFLFNLTIMTSASKLVRRTFDYRLSYFYSQANVIKHYIGNFFLPTQLSADPDLPLIRTFWDLRVIFGFLILTALLYITIRASKTKRSLPISFGIIWFYVALIPTSSIQPLGQIANDHRTFFPYVGAVLAVVWGIYLLLDKYSNLIKSHIRYGIVIAVAGLFIIEGYAYGAYQRNKVWKNSDTLWKDVAEKSPNNGRGLMNYGLTLMSKGKYDETLVIFEKALEILPYYSYLHVNMAILKNAMGDPQEAELHYKKAIRYDPNNVEAYMYYGRFLVENGQKEEAIKYVKMGLNLSPGHIKLNRYYKRLTQGYAGSTNDNSVLSDPNSRLSETDYINLGLSLFKQEKYEQGIIAWKQALVLNPNSAKAYNNIGMARMRLKEYDRAINNYKKALEIEPDFILAKNNLKYVRQLNAKK